MCFFIYSERILFLLFVCVFYIAGCLALTSSQDPTSGGNQDIIQAIEGSLRFFYRTPKYPKDCREVREQCSSSSSGVYVIKPDGYPEPFEVYCNNNIDSDGWTVIQRRFDGSLDFNRNWEDYKKGFGFLSSEFWIGNHRLSFLTNQNDYELRIDVLLSNGSPFYIKYNSFRISDEWSNYAFIRGSAGNYTGDEDVCPPGYRISRESGKCNDVDECKEIWGACSQTCLNQNGYLTCECQEGFQLINYTYCKAVDPPAAVVYVYHHNIRKFNLSTFQNGNLFTDLPSPVALEVDVNDGIVFWSDSQEHKIMMGYLNSQVEPRVVVEDAFLVDGIGYDWIHKNLYWTDTFNDTISVVSRDGGHRRTLITGNLDQPRSIAVDPRTGYMYWTDWGAIPKIERAGMNGAYRQTIIDNNKVDIHWPNGLTIDYPSDMLYWVDARHHLLATCDFNGDKYRVILRDEAAMMHPFDISVFQDEVYWTDWDASTVRRVNKFNGEGLTDVVGSLSRGTPNGLFIWHSSQQQAEENYCETGKARCSHLCVAFPEGPMRLSKYTCLCPDGIEMSSDGFTCSR